MNLYPATLMGNPPILIRSHLQNFPRKPCSRARFFTNPILIRSIEGFFSFRSYSYSLLIPNHGASKLGLEKMGLDSFRLSAASDGGSGGSGGLGGSGGGNGGEDDADDGDRERWSLFSWYLDLLPKFPVVTKAITSALLKFIGYVICQLVIDKSPFNVKRTFLFTLLGLVLVGPTLHFWYLYLSKLVTLPGALSGAILRLLLDQFVFSPIFLAVILSSLLTLEGKPHQVVPKLQQEWFSSVIVSWQLWIPFQFLNFRYVPQNFQVLAANVVSLAWNVILSFKAHKKVLSK